MNGRGRIKLLASTVIPLLIAMLSMKFILVHFVNGFVAFFASVILFFIVWLLQIVVLTKMGH